MTVRIAIIDTGIDVSHPWLQSCDIDGTTVGESSDGISVSAGFSDEIGHGTNVAALIHAFCPEAKLYAVRVSRYVNGEPNPRATESTISAAVDYCHEREIRLINLSYSFNKLRSDSPLRTACDRARTSGAVIVAAYKNGREGPVYPAALSSVIGVRHSLHLAMGRLVIESVENKDVVAWGGPFFLQHHSEPHVTCAGNSCATAHVAAMIGRMHSIDNTIDLDRAFNLLRTHAQANGETP
ncbi:MAG: S8 family peptidase [Candidatus Udaeobacter sp.]